MNRPLKHFSLCIGRELGSGGKDVAATLAKRLDASFYDRELIYHASKESGIAPELFEKADEKTKIKIAGGFFGLGFSIHGGMFPQGGFLCNEELFSIQSEVIRNLASLHSSVFVGRCADYILRDRPNCVNVFVHADLEYRIERAIRLYNLPEAKGEAIVRKTDKTRANYYHFYNENKWGLADNYHLSVNSAKLSKDKVVDIITNYVKVFQS
jgi:cytidylate kinase